MRHGGCKVSDDIKEEAGKLDAVARVGLKTLRFKDVAQILSCSPATISRLVKKGDLKHIVILENTKRIEVAEVDRYLAERRKAAEGEKK